MDEEWASNSIIVFHVLSFSLDPIDLFCSMGSEHLDDRLRAHRRWVASSIPGYESRRQTRSGPGGHDSVRGEASGDTPPSDR